MSKEQEKARKKKEQLRQDIAKQYKGKIAELEQENKMLINKLQIQQSELQDLRAKISEYEDWIERMQDFCNMSDEQRKDFIENSKKSSEIAELMSGLFNMGNLLRANISIMWKDS